MKQNCTVKIYAVLCYAHLLATVLTLKIIIFSCKTTSVSASYQNEFNVRKDGNG